MNELDAAIEDLYLAFSDLPAPKSIDACPCCFDDKNLDKLVNAIAREVSPEDLTSYASSAFLTAGDIPDYLYFLPRILEISVRDEWWWPDIEITGRALLETNIPTWPDRRQRALLAFFTAAIEHFLSAKNYEQIDSWICCIARARLDVGPFLRRIENDYEAMINYGNINAVALTKGKLSNSFWDFSNDDYREIVAWFGSERVQKIYSEGKGKTS